MRLPYCRMLVVRCGSVVRRLKLLVGLRRWLILFLPNLRGKDKSDNMSYLYILLKIHCWLSTDSKIVRSTPAHQNYHSGSFREKAQTAGVPFREVFGQVSAICREESRRMGSARIEVSGRNGRKGLQAWVSSKREQSSVWSKTSCALFNEVE